MFYRIIMQKIVTRTVLVECHTLASAQELVAKHSAKIMDGGKGLPPQHRAFDLKDEGRFYMEDGVEGVLVEAVDREDAAMLRKRYAPKPPKKAANPKPALPRPAPSKKPKSKTFRGQSTGIPTGKSEQDPDNE